jgi:glutamate dehydrogenase (NAD(P)+)
VIAIAEREGAVYNEAGLIEEDLFRHRKETGSILNFPGATNIFNTSDALELDCDVLIPAALENQITIENASRIKARIILEGANGPTTPEAEAILLKRGALIIPDVYANDGGVTVSYFEWLKNLSHVRYGRMGKIYDEGEDRRLLQAIKLATCRRFSDQERSSLIHGPDELDLVNSGLEETMAVAYLEILEVKRRHPKIEGLRTAAFLNALDKIARSYMELGIFP